MQLLLILFSLFGSTELFNKHGRKISEDKHGKDGTVSIIEDRKVAKTIAKNFKEGKLATKTDVNKGIQTTKVVLSEALHTLERTENNGGLREECSVVTSAGRVVRGKTGNSPSLKNRVSIGGATLPKLTKKENKQNATSIHSHPLKIQIEGIIFYPEAVKPSFDVDLFTFPKYGTNIIVGNLHQPYAVLVGGEIITIMPLKGVAIYKKGKGEKPVLVLNERIIEKVIE